MLREARITTIFDQTVREKKGVTKTRKKIVAITLENGEILRAVVFADTTYEGDLMAQARVTYTWGRESVSEYGESFAGVRGKQRPDHHFQRSRFSLYRRWLPVARGVCWTQRRNGARR